MFLSHLRDQLGIKGIRAVSLHEPLSNVRPVIFLQFAQGAPRTEVWRGAARRVGLARRLRQDRRRGQRRHRPDQHRRGVLVDGLSRQPGRRRACRAAPLQRPRPEVRPRAQQFIAADRRHAQAGVSAARSADPRVHGARPQDLGRARLPALSPQPPWHGYTLGDWNDTWETYAKRAVTGAWEQSGKETFAQKRGGLTPETPVRDADKPDKDRALASCSSSVAPRYRLIIASRPNTIARAPCRPRGNVPDAINSA